jgi:hypothetical protein
LVDVFLHEWWSDAVSAFERLAALLYVFCQGCLFLFIAPHRLSEVSFALHTNNHQRPIRLLMPRQTLFDMLCPPDLSASIRIPQVAAGRDCLSFHHCVHKHQKRSSLKQASYHLACHPTAMNHIANADLTYNMATHLQISIPLPCSYHRNKIHQRKSNKQE